MLHHVPSTTEQDRLFAEVLRVLRPGGLFLGTDAIDTPDLRALHVDDVFVPVDPETLPSRLARAGFVDATAETIEDRVRFRARKPVSLDPALTSNG